MGHYRLEFSKGPEVRYISHLELMRAFERAMRRAELPLAFTQGFNPHPKMAFASALPVGVTSVKEYMDLELREDLAPQELLTRLNQELPLGLKVNRCIPLSRKDKSLMATVARASYRAKVELLHPLTKAEIEEAVEKLLQKDSLLIEKEGKKGSEQKEIRQGIFSLECLKVDGKWAEFAFTVRAGSKGNIRPEEVLKALKEIASLPLNLNLALIHRTGLYNEKQEELIGKAFEAFKE